MELSKFEPFGEKFTQQGPGGQDSPVSKWLLWAGSSFFWALAAFIVVARAAYFEPGVFNFTHLAAIFRTVL
jgi:hypothetical protein